MDNHNGEDQNQQRKVEVQDQIKVDIRYLNQTFREMFTAYREKLSEFNKEKKK